MFLVIVSDSFLSLVLLFSLCCFFCLLFFYLFCIECFSSLLSNSFILGISLLSFYIFSFFQKFLLELPTVQPQSMCFPPEYFSLFVHSHVFLHFHASSWHVFSFKIISALRGSIFMRFRSLELQPPEFIQQALQLPFNPVSK